MYHAEEIVSGVLCYKSTPDGEWIPYDRAQLTNIISRERKANEIEIQKLRDKLEAYERGEKPSYSLQEHFNS